MTAPHFHQTSEAKAAIKKVEHNPDSGNGPPSGIMGGSAGNITTHTEGVTSHEKGSDWITNRKG